MRPPTESFAAAACAGVLTVLFQSGAAFAVDLCGPTTLLGAAEGRQLTFVDHPPTGLSIGDNRVGSRNLLDTDGNAVGRTSWIVTVLETGEGDSLGSGAVTQHFELSNGSIVAHYTYDARKSLDKTPPTAGQRQFAVTGGTGDFRGATGIIEYVLDDGSATYVFDIDCP